jgi:hypothetical protein
VPLFFYIFDRLSERGAKKKEAVTAAPPAAGGGAAPSTPHAPREGD